MTLIQSSWYIPSRSPTPITPTAWTNTVQLFDNVPAPRLKALTILCESTEPTEVTGPFQETPCLASLILKDIHVAWSANIYTGLLTVDLEFQSPIRPGPDADIMKLFTSSPFLETVRLVFPKGTLVTTPGSELMGGLHLMNKLRKLELKLPHDDAYHILRSLATPPDMQLILYVCMRSSLPRFVASTRASSHRACYVSVRR